LIKLQVLKPKSMYVRMYGLK